jgi:hypothetical protein
MNWDTIHTEAYREFGVEYLSPTMAASRFPNPRKRDKEIRRRHAEQTEISDTIKRFKGLMTGPNPPQTKAEAVKALSPIVSYLLWTIFKTLAIKVIEWAWDRLEKEKVSA